LPDAVHLASYWVGLHAASLPRFRSNRSRCVAWFGSLVGWPEGSLTGLCAVPSEWFPRIAWEHPHEGVSWSDRKARGGRGARSACDWRRSAPKHIQLSRFSEGRNVFVFSFISILQHPLLFSNLIGGQGSGLPTVIVGPPHPKHISAKQFYCAKKGPHD